MHLSHTEIARADAPPINHVKKRIFIIDDDASLSLTIKINLEETSKFVVGICNESDHAIDNAETFHPDLILMDLVMPGLDGGDLSAKLEQNPYLWNIPIIIVTALVSNHETGAYDGGHSEAHLMVAKPVQFSKLLHAIDTTLLEYTHH